MTNCILCHRDLLMVTGSDGSDIIAESIQFVCICFNCIKEQNKKTLQKA